MTQKRVVLASLAAWDLAWRLAAIRVALQRRERKWAVALGIVSSGGLFPIYYLLRSRRDTGPREAADA